MNEAGVRGYDMTLWQGVFVPAGTPKEIINLLSTTILKLLEDPETKARLNKAGVQIAPMNQTQFSELYFSEIARWKQVMEKTNSKLE